MFFVDSHCHLDRYDDIKPILERAAQAGIKYMLSICTSYKNFEDILRIAESFPNIYASVGLHPRELHEHSEEAIYDWLIQCSQHPKVVAFGETGLDGMPEAPAGAQQESWLRLHIEASLKTQLPLIIHLREKEKEFFNVMANYPSPPLGVLHCFTGTLACAKTALSWGWKISLSGILTFNNAKDLQNTVRELPLDGLILETDAPWLAPQNHRGQKNEPSFLVHTAQSLALLKNISLHQVAESTTHNFFNLFKKIPTPLSVSK